MQEGQPEFQGGVNGDPLVVELSDPVAVPLVTPVTTTPLTQDDIKKLVPLPEDFKVVKIGDLPELTTSGVKQPVVVTVELPDGKVVAVPVSVMVTPVNPISVPAGKTITPDEVREHFKIPEGARVVKVGDVPDTSTPGEKTPVVVTIELPGGKLVEVSVPVTVTDVSTSGDPLVIPELPEYQGGVSGDPLVVPELPEYQGGVSGDPLLVPELPEYQGGVSGDPLLVPELLEYQGGVSGDPLVASELPRHQGGVNRDSTVLSQSQSEKQELPNTGTNSRVARQMVLEGYGLLASLSLVGLVMKRRRE
ncbi:Hydroxymethylpyrimidine phosphate kinase ThiD [Streptococcus oralis]|uniref:Hydroxymethylpyrimidine phosphate kinase ThiD n=1 Tax=Streptococcus oralis TaxID=1303 RepID=A0A139RNV9_STROR|nr:Hydroxymethylpyrimidine phosphate kinase ThiD [Streptococcus oralis]